MGTENQNFKKLFLGQKLQEIWSKIEISLTLSSNNTGILVN